MPEWWTYGLSDFLLFSPRTYYRLLERYNEAVWPGQILTLGLGILIVGLLRAPSAWSDRIISTIVAVLWCWVAVAFMWARYATINWAVIYVLPMFAIEVLLLIWLGLVRNQLNFRLTGDTPGIVGSAILILAVTLYPALAPLLGRTWAQTEVFGLAPDPTVIATLGLLLLTPGRTSWALLVVPVLWSLISGLTLWATGSFEAWIPPLAAVAVLLVQALRGNSNARARLDSGKTRPPRTRSRVRC